jgi:MFS transporter, DHA1 family, tetracycline resistance protein
MEDKLDFKKILPVFVIILIDLLGLTIIIPLLPLYAASFGSNATTIGILGAIYPAAQFIGAPLLGRLSDRFGRKPVLVISQIGTMFGFILLGLANSIWLLFLARLIDGLSGANISTAQAVISDNTNAKTRTQGLGLLGAAFGLGFTVGPVIAFISLAVSNNNFHVPAFIAAAFSLISILLTWFWLDESLPAERRSSLDKKRETNLSGLREAIQRPLIGILLSLLVLQQVAFGGFQQLTALFTLNRLGLNASGNSVIYIFVGIVVVSVQGYFIGRWSRRFGEYWLIRFGLLMLAVGMILTSFTPQQPTPWYNRAAVEQQLTGGRSLPGETPPTQNLQIPLPDDVKPGWLGLAWLLIAMVPTSIGGGVLQPSINSLLTRNSKPDEVGGTLGISAALLSGANAVAPVIGGVLFQNIGPTAPYAVYGVLLILLFLWAMRTVKPLDASVPAAQNAD